MTAPGLRAWAECRLDALRDNYRLLARHAAGAALVGVVKADAYGHGAVVCAGTLAAEGCGIFGVATVEEAVELRAAGFDQPLWHLGLLAPDELADAVAARLTPTITEPVTLEALARVAPPGYPLHLKLETGMGRRGADLALLRRLWARAAAAGLTVDGLGTHLATADEDVDFAAEQIARFDRARAALTSDGLTCRWYHLANSAGLVRFGAAGGNAARPGLYLYGPGPGSAPAPALRPVLSLHARLVQVRDLPAGHDVGYAHACRLPGPTRVGLASIGYGDGLPWQLSRGAEAIVGGRRVPYLGRVNMDMIQLDLNSAPAADVGDLVTLLGGDGEAEVTRAELAGWAGCSEYAVVTQLLRRTTRVYTDAGRATARRGLDGIVRDVGGEDS